MREAGARSAWRLDISPSGLSVLRFSVVDLLKTPSISRLPPPTSARENKRWKISSAGTLANVHSLRPLLAVALSCLPLLAGITPAAEALARERMQVAAVCAGMTLPLASPEIRIFKADHRLELWASGRRLKSYPVGLGHRGLADSAVKAITSRPRADTTFRIRNAQSAFHLFLGISYPDGAAAERGLKGGLITKTQRDRILATLKRKGCPPWNTDLGGTVGIHGGGAGADWTWGCVALEDPGIEELWMTCPLGTPIIIEP